VATIIDEEIAPEISPKVSTVFFIDLSLLLPRFRETRFDETWFNETWFNETWFNAPEM
jgi:hypothetical protein